MMEILALEGKVALVTGSALRIGAAIIRRLHAEGAVVVVHYRNSADDALQLQAELNEQRAESCLLIQGDLLDIDKIPHLIAHVVKHWDLFNSLEHPFIDLEEDHGGN